jgi:hypothetical protein
MTTPSQQHLTDDQFAACLAGESPTADVRAHLAACDLCREEASLFFSSVESLDKTTLAWSKDQPSVSPRARVFQPARSFLAPSVRWVAVAALALVSVAVLLQRDYRDYRSYRTTPDAAVATASAPSDSDRAGQQAACLRQHGSGRYGAVALQRIRSRNRRQR